jgi:DNA-binding response OmpR family regulator
MTQNDSPLDSSVALRPLRVLVVDDNTDTAEALAYLVRAYGHVTRLAYNGEEALSVAQEFLPDVMLLDIGLPLLDGYAVAKMIRRRSPETEIIAITGVHDRELSLQAGMSDHFQKPIDFEAIVGVLSRVQSRLANRG